MAVFKQDSYGYVSGFTNSGKQYTFYNGYLETEDPEIIEALEANKTIEKLEEAPEDMPRPPERNGNVVVTKLDLDTQTMISPAELLSRAKKSITSTADVPQATRSDSKTSGPAAK